MSIVCLQTYQDTISNIIMNENCHVSNSWRYLEIPVTINSIINRKFAEN